MQTQTTTQVTTQVTRTCRTPYVSRAMVNAARVAAVFTSNLSRFAAHTPADVADAIAATVKAHSVAGCRGTVAQAFGDSPDTALPRIRWARQIVTQVYGTW